MGTGARTKCARQPEIRKLQVVVSPVNEQILGLQVPVQHAARVVGGPCITGEKLRGWMHRLGQKEGARGAPVGVAESDAHEYLVQVLLRRDRAAGACQSGSKQASLRCTELS